MKKQNPIYQKLHNQEINFDNLIFTKHEPKSDRENSIECNGCCKMAGKYLKVREGDCSGDLYYPKSREEIKERAEAAADRLLKMFGDE